MAIGAGDFASFRHGLPSTMNILSQIAIPTILVPGNHESRAELVDACKGTAHFHVLHGDAIRIHGLDFVGLGYGIPETPFGSWSVDLSDEQARAFLPHMDQPGVLITHSPPYGCLDRMPAEGHMGSRSIRAYIEQNRFWPLEVKWTGQVRPKDLKQIAKYSNGRILTQSRQFGYILGVPTEPLPLALLRLAATQTSLATSYR